MVGCKENEAKARTFHGVWLNAVVVVNFSLKLERNNT